MVASGFDDRDRASAAPPEPSAATPTRTERTRQSLMRSAERLFAERGVQSVSLREIAVAAGQRNHSAAVYHFGDKRELIECVLERHSDPLQAGWLKELSRLDQANVGSVAELVAIMVRSIVAKLDDADGGREYLAICAELISNRAYPILQMRVSRGPGALEIGRRLAAQVAHLPMELTVLRMTRLAAVLYSSISEYARMSETSSETTRDALVEDLVGSMVALITYGQPCAAEPTQPSLRRAR